jgi:hypothetical protein
MVRGIEETPDGIAADVPLQLNPSSERTTLDRMLAGFRSRLGA